MNIAVSDFGGADRYDSTEFLAGVPVFPLSRKTRETNRVVALDSHEENARAFNLLRSQMLREVKDGNLKIVGVTSATPSAGKSFVALNLAAACSAMSERRVLICDFDLRRGSVLEALDIEPPHDVSAYLRGTVDDWRSTIFRIEDTNLYVMPCLKHMRGSSELITSQRFQDMMAGLRAMSQEMLLICDLPPVFASDDAILTAGQLDGYVMVVEYGRNTQRQVREAMAMLSPAPCIGTILNRYRGGFFDAYGYGYGDPYGIKNYGTNA